MDLSSIENLSKNKIFKTLKAMLFFIPISIITYNILNFVYGDLVLALDLEKVDCRISIIAFLIFAGISFTARLIEDMLLPFYLFPKVPSLNPIKTLMTEKVDKVFNNWGVDNPYKTFTKEQPAFKFYDLLCTIFINLFLWCFTINTWLAIFPLILIVSLATFMASIINTILVRKQDDTNNPNP
jgi:hypothetical protein